MSHHRNLNERLNVEVKAHRVKARRETDDESLLLQALAAATRTLAIEYGEHKIRVNSLHCGPILNDALLHALENLARERGTTRDEEYERIASMSALGFMPTPEDYMGSVLYLLSDMSSPVTGISLHVNAGRFMV